MNRSCRMMLFAVVAISASVDIRAGQPSAAERDQAGSRAVATFQQGLWRGEDPRVTFHNGWYYYVENPSSTRGRRTIYKSKSLVERGEPRLLPEGFPLFAPLYIDALNGIACGKWYAFDGQVWECSGDPYDSAPEGWKRIKRIPFKHWTIDHFVFKAESGPVAGQWFMVWAGQEREDDPKAPNKARYEWWFESIYIARMASLRAGEETLENCDDTAANRIINYRFHSSKPMKYPVPREAAGAWKDVVAEAPCVVQKDGTISIIYSGDGAQTSHYAMGISFCKDGNVLNPGSWVDWNQDVNPGPEFQADFAKGVFGPGVARIVPSPDGREDWMFYHSKIWDTWNRADRAQEEGQQSKEMWSRFINLKRIGWQRVSHGGQTYTIPDLGTPDAPGTRLPLPSGDPGVAPCAACRIEAERMIPFGYVMGDAVQSLPGGLDVLKIEDAAASGGAYMGRFDKLVADAPDRRAGLIYRNTPGGRRLLVRAASPLEKPAFDIYVDGELRTTLKLARTGSWTVFQDNECDVEIPLGGEVKLLYQQGKHDASNVDYIILKSDR